MSPFRIEVEFDASWPVAHRTYVDLAVQRWMRVIGGSLPSVDVRGRRVDGLLISASLVNSGTGGMLGASGPVELRPQAAGPAAYIPATAVLRLDAADFNALIADGRLMSVIVHEVGHALGIGFIWPWRGLIRGAGTSNPTFVGPSAMREYGSAIGAASSPVPVENSGGAGSVNLHWREARLASELMTPRPVGPVNPLSRITVGSLEDVGYSVDYAAADPYIPPKENFFRGLLRSFNRRAGHIHRSPPTTPKVLPDDAVINE